MVALPVERPVTMPVAFTVATAVLLLVQERVLPGEDPPNWIAEPVQMVVLEAVPEITGADRTVTEVLAVAGQPLPGDITTVYLIKALPVPVPVTTPAFVIVATLVLTLLQIPPAIAWLSARVAPGQTEAEFPEMGVVAGVCRTVITR
jgi:hypothetical protein